MENRQNTEEIIEEVILEDEEDILEDYIDIYDISDLDTSKPMWQQMKEQQYDKLNITVKQLDIIIGVCVAGLIIVGILIGLEATGII
ncbi:MAG: hypothetical protein IJ362_08880 [Oscillospiraceae bacterium]|nr:hypothetical protein [Oscillospiraceae bacterium]